MNWCCVSPWEKCYFKKNIIIIIAHELVLRVPWKKKSYLKKNIIIAHELQTSGTLRAKLAKRYIFFKFLGQTRLLWCLFEIWTHSKSSLWKTLLNVKIVFLKDTFWPNFGQKLSLEKMILRNIFLVIFRWQKMATSVN